MSVQDERSTILGELLQDLQSGNVPNIRSQILTLRQFAQAGELNLRLVLPLLKRILVTHPHDATLVVRCLHLTFLFRQDAALEFATLDWACQIVTSMKHHAQVIFVQAICFAWLLWLVADAGGNIRAIISQLGGIECVLDAIHYHRCDAQIQEAAGLFLTRMRQGAVSTHPHPLSLLSFGDSDRVIPFLLRLPPRMVHAPMAWGELDADDDDEDDDEDEDDEEAEQGVGDEG